MLNEQISGVLRSALLSVSKSTSVELKTLRIKMKLTDDLQSVECIAMNGTEVLDVIGWHKILGIKAIAFKGKVISTIKNKITEISSEKDFDLKDVNVRVYATDLKGNPSGYLYNGGKAVHELKLEELM